MRQLAPLSLAFLLVAACAHDEQAPGGRANLDLDPPFAAETPGLSDPLSDAAEAEEARIREDGERKIEALRANPPRLATDRKIPGYRIGRCFLAVDGVTRINGPCYFRIEEDGSFQITGPRQVFRGVDFPENRAWDVSTDWWADVFRQDGDWTGYGNNAVDQINGQGSRWGTLEQEGACYSNERTRRDYKPGDDHEDYQDKVRVCLWRE